MTSAFFRFGRFALVVVAVGALASCGLPRSGPTKKEIFEGSVQRSGDAFIVGVTDQVTAAANYRPSYGFSKSFLNAGPVNLDSIQPGDTLNLTIYEVVDDGLLTKAAGTAGAVSELQVDGTGHIFMPYVGRIKASGNSVEALRNTLTRRLSDQTPDPQIQLIRVPGEGSSVTVAGDGAAQGIFKIERATRRLAAMVAKVGVTSDPEITLVTVIRGKQRRTIWYSELLSNTRNNIALRNGDRIIIKKDNRSFVALGATGSSSIVEFDRPEMSALEAVAASGGLSTSRADPKGIFVFRDEKSKVANTILGRNDLSGSQRFVFLLDLTAPNGVFHARDFLIRDGDTVYVTEAPFTQWDKTISALTGSLNSVNGLAQIAK